MIDRLLDGCWGRVRMIAGMLLSFVVVTLVLMVMGGCALQAVDPPQSDFFAQLSAPDIAMSQPVPLPERPQATVLKTESGDYMAFDPAGAKQLVQRDESCEVNADIAHEAALGFDAMTASYSLLLGQAQAHERAYNLLGRRWGQAETQLNRAEVTHGVENWFNRALLLAAVGLAL